MVAWIMSASLHADQRRVAAFERRPHTAASHADPSSDRAHAIPQRKIEVASITASTTLVLLCATCEKPVQSRLRSAIRKVTGQRFPEMTQIIASLQEGKDQA